jgi:hypothetical protein
LFIGWAGLFIEQFCLLKQFVYWVGGWAGMFVYWTRFIYTAGWFVGLAGLFIGPLFVYWVRLYKICLLGKFVYWRIVFIGQTT